jgi:hypothetical protein
LFFLSGFVSHDESDFIATVDRQYSSDRQDHGFQDSRRPSRRERPREGGEDEIQVVAPAAAVHGPRQSGIRPIDPMSRRKQQMTASFRQMMYDSDESDLSTSEDMDASVKSQQQSIAGDNKIIFSGLMGRGGR